MLVTFIKSHFDSYAWYTFALYGKAKVFLRSNEKNFDKLSIEHKLRLRLCEIIHSPPLCLYSLFVDIDSDIKLSIIEKAIA